WSLRWRPQSVLQIIEAGVYGNTLVEAAGVRAVERAEATTELGQTAALVEVALLADLDNALPRLVGVLGTRSAESTDVSQMLRALPPLASTLRYGDVRRTDTTALASVVRALAERVTVGLGPACAGLDDEAADGLADEIVAATQALAVLAYVPDSGRMVEDWWAVLTDIPNQHDVAHLIAGTCTRLSLNAERISIPQAEERLGRALARGTAPADAARWIEGFLKLRLGPKLG